VRAQGMRAIGIFGGTGQQYGRLAIRAEGVGPEADVGLQFWVGIIHQGTVEKSGNNRGTNTFLRFSFQCITFPLISSNSLKVRLLLSFDPHRPYQHLFYIQMLGKVSGNNG
jgi:hypothetical protein